MNRSELIKIVARDSGQTHRVTEAVVEAVFSTIMSGVASDERVVLSGFGTFVKRTRKARKGRDPKKETDLFLPEMETIGFLPAKSWKKSLRGGPKSKLQEKSAREKCSRCQSTNLLDNKEGDIPFRICQDCGNSWRLPVE